MPIYKDDNIGKVFGIFKITEVVESPDNDGHKLYKGICTECGLEKIKRLNDFKRATTRCNHVSRVTGEFTTSHKWKNFRLQRIFHDMRQRCYNQENSDYVFYGAKGIQIDSEWLKHPEKFEEWAMENGYKDGLTIDRIDSNSNYCASNCRWVTAVENCTFKGNTNVFTVDGKFMSGNQVSLYLGLYKPYINKYKRMHGHEATQRFIDEKIHSMKQG